MINILLVGDIVGSPGRAILKLALPKILRKRSIDYCIANAENLAGGNGVTRELAEELGVRVTSATLTIRSASETEYTTASGPEQ